QGRQGCNQVDAAVMPNIRRQRGAPAASCARLQSRQFPAHAGDAGADQGLVADEPEGEADQDRREGGEPRPLCYLPDGRGRHRTANVPGNSAPYRGTAAAATTSASMRRSIVMRSRATEGRSVSECQRKRPDQTLNVIWGARNAGSHPRLPFGLPGNPEKRYRPRQSEVHPGNPGLNQCPFTLPAIRYKV